MKTRANFVSNSSSSSFIVESADWIDYFGITKADFAKALSELSGGKLEEGRDFWVYDLADKANRAQARRRWGGLLKNWNSNRLVSPKGGRPAYDPAGITEYEMLCESLRKCFDLPYGFEDYCAAGDSVPEYVAKTTAEARDRVGIITNFEVLGMAFSRFFVHFADNGVNMLDGMHVNSLDEDDGQDPAAAKYRFQSEAYTMQRVAEILYRYFVGNRKIDPSDEKFLEGSYGLDPGNRKNGRQYCTRNGVDFGWEDAFDAVLTYCMHEG